MPREEEEYTNSMDGFINVVGKQIFGIGRKQAHKLNICVTCKDSVLVLRDELSYKEYKISGMCQMCQDKVFKEEE